MADIKSIREQFPQYDDLSDADLADKIYAKFYSDIPRPEFDAKIGIAQPDPNGKWQNVPIPYDMAAPGAENVDYGDTYGPGVSFLRSVGQGAMLGYGDEIGGALKGYIPALVTGEDPRAAYTRVRDQYRKQSEMEAAKNPKAATAGDITGQVATGLGAGLLTGGGALPVLSAGAGLGAASGLGYSDAPLVSKDAAIDTAVGGGVGAAGAGLGLLASKALSALLPSGQARTYLDQYGNMVDDAIAKGGRPAEASPAAADALRGAAQANPARAASYLDDATARLSGSYDRAISEIDSLVSPEGATETVNRINQALRPEMNRFYQSGQYLSPDTVPIPDELANKPLVKDALAFAKEAAENSGRAFDEANLTMQDIDLVQKYIRSVVKTGEKAAQGLIDNPRLAAGTEIAKNVRQEAIALADLFPDDRAANWLTARTTKAAAEAQKEAVDEGLKALSSKTVEQVADEFPKLNPQQQAAYRAAIAERLKNMAGAKMGARSPERIFEIPNLVEKLKVIGVPEREIARIVDEARGVSGFYDALAGGSKTGANQAAARALQNPLERITGGDLTGAALTGGAGVILPAVRGAGAKLGQRAAGLLVDALASPTPQNLIGLLQNAPQEYRSLLGLGGAGAASGLLGLVR